MTMVRGTARWVHAHDTGTAMRSCIWYNIASV